MKHFAWLVFVIASTAQLMSCQKQESNQLDIVGGSLVSEYSTGPERLSTVAIDGCSGVIVAEDLILTAAHCTSLAISGGVVYFGNNLDSFKLEAIPIIKVFKHPSYTGPGNDFTLLKLFDPIPAGYEPIELLDPSEPIFQGEYVRLAGFGSNNKGDYFGRLRVVESVILERASNESLYVENGSTAACGGDSGGPMFLLRGDQWYLAGVTATALANQNTGECVGGNYYAPIQENYNTLLSMARSLTGRNQPFKSIASQNQTEIFYDLPKLSIRPDFFIEASASVNVELENKMPRDKQALCELRLEVIREMRDAQVRYELSTQISIDSSTSKLELDDYLAKKRSSLGPIVKVSLQNSKCKDI